MTVVIADLIQHVADAKAPQEQADKIAAIEEVYGGYLHGNPDMSKARAVMQRHGVIPTP